MIGRGLGKDCSVFRVSFSFAELILLKSDSVLVSRFSFFVFRFLFFVFRFSLLRLLKAEIVNPHISMGSDCPVMESFRRKSYFFTGSCALDHTILFKCCFCQAVTFKIQSSEITRNRFPDQGIHIHFCQVLPQHETLTP